MNFRIQPRGGGKCNHVSQSPVITEDKGFTDLLKSPAISCQKEKNDLYILQKTRKVKNVWLFLFLKQKTEVAALNVRYFY